MKKYVLTLPVLFFVCLAAWGQDLERYKYRLMQPGPHGAKVEVVERGDAAQIVGTMSAARASQKINGYRVRLFFDNSQNAKQAAAATLARFKEAFPDIPASLSYDNPYFKVTAGNCLTAEEAVILWGQVKESFDKAFVTREEISLSLLEK